MGPRPRCYIQGFTVIFLLVLGKMFEGFYHILVLSYIGRGGCLGHVTHIHVPQSNVCPPITLMLHVLFGFYWPNGFGEDL